jgi:hypothetical protein
MEKIKRLWTFLVYQLLYIQDEPDSKYKREWRRWLDTYKKDSFVAVSYEVQLTQFEGKPTTPRSAVIKQLGLEFNPRKWHIGQDHTYYDGNHCQYHFGPVSYYTSGTKDCPKCRSEA